MIISIESSIPTFKPIRFHGGLNVLLAEKSQNATAGQSRNGVGKSSLLDIIHFLLGGKAGVDGIFRLPELNDHTFVGTFKINDRLVKVQRSGATAKHVYILDGLEGNDVQTKLDKKTGLRYLSNPEWCEYLGHAMFGMPYPTEGTPFGESYTPSFRSMFTYFARRHSSGGMLEPIQQAKMQSTWDWQENLSYLFGLD